MKLILLFLVFVLISCNNSKLQSDIGETTLLIGTFNIEWLGDGIDDNNPRTEEDYKNIAFVIEDTGAEILALQEVENVEAIKKIIKYLPNWEYIFLHKEGDQNNCYLHKKNVPLEDAGLYNNLQIENSGTRKGAVAKLKYGDIELIFLNVHLKSTSSYDDTEEKKQRSFELRRLQSAEIIKFKDSIIANNIAENVIVLGDFNDNPIRAEKSNILALDSNFYLATNGLESCKSKYYDLIDHIFISESLIDNLEPVSAYVYNISTVLNEEQTDKVSDHCPVIVRINTK